MASAFDFCLRAHPVKIDTTSTSSLEPHEEVYGAHGVHNPRNLENQSACPKAASGEIYSQMYVTDALDFCMHPLQVPAHASQARAELGPGPSWAASQPTYPEHGTRDQNDQRIEGNAR